MRGAERTQTETQRRWKGRRHQLAQVFHSACCRVFVARAGVLAMHQLSSLQNLSEMSLESVTFRTITSMLKHSILKACNSIHSTSGTMCYMHIFTFCFCFVTISLHTAFSFDIQKQKKTYFLLIAVIRQKNVTDSRVKRILKGPAVARSAINLN